VHKLYTDCDEVRRGVLNNNVIQFFINVKLFKLQEVCVQMRID
jgi:hypothetical protein